MWRNSLNGKDVHLSSWRCHLREWESVIYMQGRVFNISRSVCWYSQGFYFVKLMILCLEYLTVENLLVSLALLRCRIFIRVFPYFTKLTTLASNSNASDDGKRMKRNSFFPKINIYIRLFGKKNSFLCKHYDLVKKSIPYHTFEYCLMHLNQMPMLSTLSITGKLDLHDFHSLVHRTTQCPCNGTFMKSHCVDSYED